MDAEKYKFKIAVIAGASKALNLKQQNPRLTDEEVIQEVAEQAKQILFQIDEE